MRSSFFYCHRNIRRDTWNHFSTDLRFSCASYFYMPPCKASKQRVDRNILIFLLLSKCHEYMSAKMKAHSISSSTVTIMIKTQHHSIDPTAPLTVTEMSFRQRSQLITESVLINAASLQLQFYFSLFRGFQVSTAYCNSKVKRIV